MSDTIYDWSDVRDKLEHDIEVYYTRNNDLNRKREQDKKETIDWIIKRMQKGPDMNGTMTKQPEFTWTFGGAMWDAVRNVMHMYHPVCAICNDRPTVEIHHIRPRYLRGAEYDPCNLLWLCKECHDEVHRRMDKGISEAIKDSIATIDNFMGDNDDL